MHSLFLNAIKLTCLAGLVFSSQSFGASSCPSAFFELPLPTKTNTCTTLSDRFPAALTFHSPASPKAMFQFYSEQPLAFERKEKHLGRFVLIAGNDQYRVVISPDKHGSQIDLLYLNQ